MKMHYSQVKKNSSRPHPGTPRPDFGSSGDSPTEKQHKVERKQQIDHSSVTPLIDANLPKFLIWVKNEPFDFGILSPHPCPKIGINILRKIAEYCREKPGHYPDISLNQWNHICKYKIQLSSSSLCTAYFRVFDIISRSANSWSCQNDVGQRNTARASNSSTKLESMSDSRDVKFYKMLNQGHDSNDDFKANTLSFLLFLYIQHFLRLHKKFVLRGRPRGDDPWPKFLNNRNHSHAGANVIPEQQHAEFVTANLEDLINFLMIIHAKRIHIKSGRKSKTRSLPIENFSSPIEDYDDRVALPVIKALSLILGAASVTHDREFKYLDDCLSLPEVAKQLDYDRGTYTVDRACFLRWIISNLKINPWGPSAIPIPQVPVYLMTGICSGTGNEAKGDSRDGGDGRSALEIFRKNKIFWNTQCHPKAWFLVSNVEKQTLLFDSLEPFSSIKIHRCQESNIYIPGCHNMILIQKCHNLILNLGVVTKIVKVVDSSNLTVSAAGRLIIIQDTVSSVFHLLTPSSPIICGNKTSGVQLAPYNTSYSDLPMHLNMAGMSPEIQKWNKPLELTSDGYPYDHSGHNHDSSVSILRPDHFKLTTFPFKKLEAVQNNSELSPFPPGALSEPYMRKLTATSDNSTKVKEEFRKLCGSRRCPSGENVNLLYRITLDRFKKWLKDTGNYEQILGLLSFHKSLDQDVSSPIMLSGQLDLACISKSLRKFFGISTSTGRSASPLYGPRIRYHEPRERDEDDAQISFGGAGEGPGHTPSRTSKWKELNE